MRKHRAEFSFLEIWRKPVAFGSAAEDVHCIRSAVMFRLDWKNTEDQTAERLRQETSMIHDGIKLDHVPAVHGQLCAGYVAGLAAAQKPCCVGNVLECSDILQRRVI